MLQKILLSITVLLIYITASTTSGDSGFCFMKRFRDGSCGKSFIRGSRALCCVFNGFFVRKVNEQKLFLHTYTKSYTFPNCEKACDTDFCANKTCTDNSWCIQRSSDSICSNECKCTEQDRKSGPICLTNYLKYKNLCEVKKKHCYDNTRYTIKACSLEGCERIRCPTAHPYCFLTSKGFNKCAQLANCSSVKVKPVCGVDNITYANRCEMFNKNIQSGKEIDIAYYSSCRANATCQTISCPSHASTCIRHSVPSKTNPEVSLPMPVCKRCPASCSTGGSEAYNEFCLSVINARTKNYCLKESLACTNRRYYEIVKSGNCLLTANRDFR